jgi:hypothetical protein
MSYKSALIAAGADVLAFEQFGEYSGMWLAKVSYNGETGYIMDWFGSCTYCDDFEANFHLYDREETDEEYNKRLADFGKTYLDKILPAEHYLEMFDGWDDEEADASAWIKKIEGIE